MATPHAPTDNTHLPKKGVKVRYSSIRGKIEDGGAMLIIHINNKDEPVYIPKNNKERPFNFRNIFKDALSKAEE